MIKQKPAPTPIEAVAAISDLQKRTGLNLTQIADATHVARQKLVNWSKGQRNGGCEPKYSAWIEFWAEAEKLLAAKNGKKGR